MRTLAASALVVAALAQQPAQPPAQPPPQTPQPTFRTEANFVRVDAYPTKDGAPVADLTQADFEILENGVVQKIDQFERVVIRGNIPEAVRREPNSVEESRQAAQNPRSRVFVVFLDINQVSVDGSHNIRRPLVDALNRLIGPEDLVAVMTPEMAASQITFARRTTTIEGMLTRYWNWGERDSLNSRDPQEDQYRACYPGIGPTALCSDDDRGVADEMIERRREKQTMNALEDLTRYLRGVREERKAIIAISDGWRLFRSNPGLARRLYCQVPTAGQAGVDPGTGRLAARAKPNQLGSDPNSCDPERLTLAYMDDDAQFRQILDEANRANASFYPVDPRGLVVFDEPISKPTTGLPLPGSTTVTPPSVDHARLASRLTSLRTLAEATDGIALVDSNNITGGLQRVVNDLSSYYLIGYYSGGKLDGKFHPITVRVKRPSVQVRARRGYLAATPASAAATAASAAALATPAKVDAEAAAVTAAIGPLAGYTREVPLRIQAATGWKPGSPPAAAVWVVGELSSNTEFGDVWKGGAVAEVELLPAAGGSAVVSARATIPASPRVFRVALVPTQPLAAGDYIVRIGARAGPASLPSRDSLHVSVPASPDAAGAIWIRRSPATGNRETPTADLRFRRNEQVRVEIPTMTSEAGGARLLDRSGKVLAVPVATGVRDDADGSRWRTGQLALAPLATGDYVIEIAEGEKRMLAAFRVVP